MVFFAAEGAFAADPATELAELDQWYSSICPAAGPDESTATITESLMRRIDRVRDDVRKNVASVSAQLEDPDVAVERERSLMRKAISETRADYNGAIHQLSWMSTFGATAQSQAQQRLKVRAIKEKKKDLELRYALGDYLQGARVRHVGIASEQLSGLRDQQSRLERLYENTRECQSVARGNIGDQDPVTGERLGVNEVEGFSGGLSSAGGR